VTLTAVVANSGGAIPGTVEFFDGRSSIGTANLSNNQASMGTSALSVGTHSLTAHYQGTSRYAASTSSVISQTVLPR
jgi:trimeric autotransporter adhesin